MIRTGEKNRYTNKKAQFFFSQIKISVWSITLINSWSKKRKKKSPIQCLYITFDFRLDGDQENVKLNAPKSDKLQRRDF